MQQKSIPSKATKPCLIFVQKHVFESPYSFPNCIIIIVISIKTTIKIILTTVTPCCVKPASHCSLGLASGLGAWPVSMTAGLFSRHCHYCTGGNCTVTALYVWQYTALHWTTLNCTALYYTALYCTALHCTALH